MHACAHVIIYAREKKKKYYRKKQQYSESSEVFDTSADEDSLNSEQDHDDSNREGNKKKLLLELMYDKNYRPMKFRELCVLLDVSKARRYELETALNQLVDEGKIGISAHGKYGKPELFTLKGSFSSTSRGFGFVTVEENSLHTVDFKPSFSISFWVEFNHLHAV